LMGGGLLDRIKTLLCWVVTSLGVDK